MMADMVWLDDRLVASHASIDATDRGYTLGDGLFETMLWTGTAIRNRQRHFDRLCASCKALGFDGWPGAARIEAAVDAVIEGTGLSDGPAVVRVTWSRGAGPRGLALPPTPAHRLLVTATPHIPMTVPLRLWRSSIMRPWANPSAAHKTLSYIDSVMAMDDARQNGCDEALLTGRDGRLACAAAGNLVVVHAGRAVTPPVRDGALPGTMRAALIDAGVVSVAPVTAALLEQADAVGLTNAVHGVRLVVELAGRAGERALDPHHPVLSLLCDVVGALSGP